MTGSSTGAALRLRMLREATYNTAPGGNYWNIPLISHDLGTGQENEPNPSIAHGSDPAAPLRGVFDGKSDLSVPVEARYMGLHLAALFGDPVTTDIGTPYQHVFSSNATGQPTSQAIEVAHLGLSTPKYIMNSGILYNDLGLTFKRSGFVEAKFGVIVTKEADPAGSTAAGTPANLVDANIKYFSHLTGVIKREGTALGTVLSGDLNFSYNLNPLEVIGNNGYIAGADRGEASLSVNLASRFRDMTLYDDARGGGPVQIDWILSNSADESLTFTLSNMVLARPKIGASGPSGIDVSFSMMGYGTAAEKALTATLINDYAGTGYAA